MCGVSAEKIINVEGGISPTGQLDSSKQTGKCLKDILMYYSTEMVKNIGV